jgi:hypothetical protein
MSHHRIVHWDPRYAASFRRHAFSGFTPLGEVVDAGTAFVARHASEFSKPGVYAVFAPRNWKPTWLAEPEMSNVISPWPAQRLHDRWVEGVELVYIGCAGRTPSSRILGKRIGDLLRHGSGQVSSSGPHKGGERLWQCADWEDFQLAWKPTGPYPQPHDLEVAIGERFLRLTGQLPFCNARL